MPFQQPRSPVPCASRCVKGEKKTELIRNEPPGQEIDGGEGDVSDLSTLPFTPLRVATLGLIN